ncbi:hypothetical protein LZN18_26715, partial [Pseudomonas aeruginosa]|nr:hypothetical protein [Pseudomonas aeruginosa]
ATFGPLVKRMTPGEEHEQFDWAGDADLARLQQEPLRARLLLRLAAAVLLALFAAGAVRQSVVNRRPMENRS